VSDGTIHFIYPHGSLISCPQAIGRNVAARLRLRYGEVRQYDWDEIRTIRPRPGDILIGHPHPYPWTIFRLSARQPGWRRVVAMAPYNHGTPAQLAYADPVVERCDAFLAITGNYWFRRVESSPFRHWRKKMIHLDLAVDRVDFPRIKGRFAAPGLRRIVYIGHSGWTKNVGYLTQIARELPEAEISWIGKGTREIPRLRRLGPQDFQTEQARALLSGFDFMLTVGRSDANPATILESMAWGLIPVATAQSGYEGYRGIVNVPLDDPPGAAAVLRGLLGAPESELEAFRRDNDVLLENHFNWERVASQVVHAIEDEPAHTPWRQSAASRSHLCLAALFSPYSFLYPRSAVRELHRLCRLGLTRRAAAAGFPKVDR
jgi:glycosyltransferase involved in cell wall biosynthesis